MKRAPFNRASTIRRSLALVALLCLASNAWAEADATRWEQLSPDEQKVLERARDRWDTMTPEQQQRLRRGASRWEQMSPEQRTRAQERLRAVQQESPEQRALRQQQLERFRNLPPETQERLRRSQQQFQSLPSEKRQQLREDWKNAGPEERARMRQRLDRGRETGQGLEETRGLKKHGERSSNTP